MYAGSGGQEGTTAVASGWLGSVDGVVMAEVIGFGGMVQGAGACLGVLEEVVCSTTVDQSSPRERQEKNSSPRRSISALIVARSFSESRRWGFGCVTGGRP